MGGVPREQKVFKGHLLRVIYRECWRGEGGRGSEARGGGAPEGLCASRGISYENDLVSNLSAVEVHWAFGVNWAVWLCCAFGVYRAFEVYWALRVTSGFLGLRGFRGLLGFWSLLGLWGSLGFWGLLGFSEFGG